MAEYQHPVCGAPPPYSDESRNGIPPSRLRSSQVHKLPRRSKSLKGTPFITVQDKDSPTSSHHTQSPVRPGKVDS